MIYENSDLMFWFAKDSSSSVCVLQSSSPRNGGRFLPVRLCPTWQALQKSKRRQDPVACLPLSSTQRESKLCGKVPVFMGETWVPTLGLWEAG